MPAYCTLKEAWGDHFVPSVDVDTPNPDIAQTNAIPPRGEPNPPDHPLPPSSEEMEELRHYVVDDHMNLQRGSAEGNHIDANLYKNAYHSGHEMDPSTFDMVVRRSYKPRNKRRMYKGRKVRGQPGHMNRLAENWGEDRIEGFESDDDSDYPSDYEENLYEDSCDLYFDHIKHCRMCRKRLTRFLLPRNEHNNKRRSKSRSSKSSNGGWSLMPTDMSEILIFIVTGVFLIFILDTFVRMGKNMRA